MTSLLSSRPGHRDAGDGSSGSSTSEVAAPLVWAGALASLRAAALSLLTVAVVVVVGWAGAAGLSAGAGDALRTAGQAWLLGHHVPLAVPGGALRISPLGLLLLPGLLLFQAGGRAARASRPVNGRERAVVLGAVTLTYAVMAALVAVLSGTAAVRPSVPWAAVAGALLALLAGGLGVRRATATPWPLVGRLPALVRTAARAGAAAAGVVLGAGALLLALSLLLHAGRLAELVQALHPGLLGGSLLALLCVLLLPNAALWAAAFVAGPGFAVGVGTSVAPGGVDVGALPALPVLAAVPAGGSLPLLVRAVVVVPVLAGALAGWMALRHEPAPARPEGTGLHAVPWRALGGAAARAALAGPVAAVVLAVPAALSGGAAGGDRLGDGGPPGGWGARAGAVEVGGGAALAAAAVVLRRCR
ncbi:MAG: cell division protein PerM [Motilibacteraceae bacterium]